jgi:hypothetical protein
MTATSLARSAPHARLRRCALAAASLAAAAAFPQLPGALAQPPWAAWAGRNEKEWEALAKPWPSWTPCDGPAAWRKNCRPRAATCEEESKRGPNGHGIGNTLRTTYAPEATEVFARGCAIIFNEAKVAEDPRSRRFWGDPADGSLFMLQRFMEKPRDVPANTAEPCVMWALTQPLEKVAAAVTAVKAVGAYDATLPLVAVQIRSGWADAPREKAAQHSIA